MKLLLFIPWICLLWPPFYVRWDPTMFGIPFFFWFQFAWIFITAALTAVVYWGTR